MPTYSRNQTITQTQDKSPIESKDLSTVIIESFDSVKEQMESINDGGDEKESDLSSLLKQSITQQDEILKLLTNDKADKANKDNSKVGQVSTIKDKELQALLQKNNVGKVETDKAKNNTDVENKNKELKGLVESKQERDNNKAKDNAREAKAESSRNKQILTLNLMNKGISSIVGSLAKAALVVVALSQAIVLVKAGWAWLQNYMPIKLEKIIADIKAAVITIPEKIKLNLQKIMSEVRINDKPIFSFSGLNADEQTEKKQLEQNKDVKQYNKLQGDIEKKEKEKELMIKNAAKLAGMDTDNLDVNDPAVREKIKSENMKRQKELLDNSSGGYVNGGYVNEGMYKQAVAALQKGFASWDEADASINKLKTKQQALIDKSSSETKKKITRYAELKDKESLDYNEESAKLETKQKDLSDKFFMDMRKSDYEKGIHSTETQAEISAKMLGKSLADYKAEIAGGDAKDYVAKGNSSELRGDKYLRNEFADWTRAWEQLAHNLKQNFGLRVEQLPPKYTEKNPTSCR